LILLDALNAKHVSHLGGRADTTPSLDALAAEGISFAAAYAPAPYTLATVPSIFTGRLPDAHGLVDKSTTLLAEEVTLAELLSRAGYRTFAAVGNLNGSSIFGCEQGFDEYVEVFRAEDGRSVDVEVEGKRYHEVSADDYPPIVRRWLAARETQGGAGERPPFFYLHILQPHEPYAAPDEFRRRFVDPAYAGPYAAGDSAALGRGRRGKLPFDGHDRAAVEALYDANLAHADAVVGEVLELIEAAGLLDDALVLVTSDHGEAFWEHGEQGHNTTLFDEMLHVPLIARLPRGTLTPYPANGARPSGLVSPMDLVPTICEWLDLPLPAVDLDGVSLTAALRGEQDQERALVLRSYHEPAWFGLRSARTKTVVVQGDFAPRVEHYRLDVDPGETESVRASYRADADADVRVLQRYAAEGAQGRARRGLPLSAAETTMLERLGYVGGD
jgi:arylsulfatase A-like enzyme